MILINNLLFVQRRQSFNHHRCNDKHNSYSIIQLDIQGLEESQTPLKDTKKVVYLGLKHKIIPQTVRCDVKKERDKQKEREND